jgi:hypothetical protein
MKTMKLKLSRRQLGCLVLYVVLIAIALVFIHEAAHILTAVIRGVPFNELKLGFWGINPSITLPQWVDENTRTVIFYAGGLTTGRCSCLVICSTGCESIAGNLHSYTGRWE